MRRASDETWAQRWVRRWVRAQFRGGEKPVLPMYMLGQTGYTLNDYLASGRFERWAERWFWLAAFVVAIISAALSIGAAIADPTAPWWVAAFGIFLLYFALRILAGVRCLFRNRKRPRRKSRH